MFNFYKKFLQIIKVKLIEHRDKLNGFKNIKQNSNGFDTLGGHSKNSTKSVKYSIEFLDCLRKNDILKAKEILDKNSLFVTIYAQNALEIGISNENSQIVDLFLGNNLDGQNWLDFCFKLALNNGSLKMIEYMKQKGAYLFYPENLVIPCMQGKLDIVQYLVRECEVNVSAKYEVALRSAAETKKYEVMAYLIQEGADLNQALYEAKKNLEYAQMEGLTIYLEAQKSYQEKAIMQKFLSDLHLPNKKTVAEVKQYNQVIL